MPRVVLEGREDHGELSLPQKGGACRRGIVRPPLQPLQPLQWRVRPVWGGGGRVEHLAAEPRCSCRSTARGRCL